MDVFARHLSRLPLGLRGVAYLEGGPEASLVVNAEAARAQEMGSYEDGLDPNDGNREFWDLPNVLGFVPIER
jgi:hypothetical protein